jgi:hypothetical protein
MCPFQIWAKSRQIKGIAAGGIAAENAAGAIIRSPLLPANAAKKQPFADETVSLEAIHPMCPEGNWHGPPARTAGFSASLTPKYRVACSLTRACPNRKWVLPQTVGWCLP